MAFLIPRTCIDSNIIGSLFNYFHGFPFRHSFYSFYETLGQTQRVRHRRHGDAENRRTRHDGGGC